jgi:hypothetical protein
MKTSGLQKTKDMLSHFERGEVTIVLGENALSNMQASLVQAEMLLASGRFDSVIYMNLPFSRRKFTDARREFFREDPARMTVYHVASGHLARTVGGLEQNLTNPERTALIINSWELSSSCYRYREDLIFKLHELQMSLDLTVIVYAMSKPSSVEAGKTNRTGLGKLTITADSVIDLSEADGGENSPAEDAEKAMEANIPSGSSKNAHAATGITPEGRIAQLPANEFNDLPYADGHLSENEDYGEEEYEYKEEELAPL